MKRDDLEIKNEQICTYVYFKVQIVDWRYKKAEILKHCIDACLPIMHIMQRIFLKYYLTRYIANRVVCLPYTKLVLLIKCLDKWI